MPRIVPITDLRNYTKVLNQVDIDKPVYLTRNGRGTYVLSKIDDYDREETIEDLVKEIKKGAASFKQGKTIPLTTLAQEFNIEL